MLGKNRSLFLANIVGIITVIALLLLQNQITRSSVVSHETRSNTDITQVLSNTIWPRHRAWFLSAGDKIRLAKGALPEIETLHREIESLIRGSHIIKVKIYDAQGLTVYSSDPSQIGVDKGDNQGVRNALAGEAASMLTFRDEFDAFERRLSDVDVVSSYVPIFPPAGGEPEAVFEVYSDVTGLVRHIQQNQLNGVFGVLASVAAIYGLLLLAARKADFSEVRRMEEAAEGQQRLLRQAYHDALTGLKNRAGFLNGLEHEVRQAHLRGSGIALLLLDVDRFRLVNDSFGHEEGDALLVKIAKRLRGCLGERDSLFRSGGDEFAIIVDDPAGEDGGVSMARRVLDKMRQPVLINRHTIVSTISIGVARYPQDDRDPIQLIKNADAAMCKAKDEGRNRYSLYVPSLTANSIERLSLVSALQQALSKQEFVLYYQPRMASDGVSVAGFEALIRWRREGTIVSPGVFMPVLEQSGLIAEVGHWVIREACTQAVAWQRAGLVPVRISVNVSPRQFSSVEFYEDVVQVIEETGIDARCLEIELTESALLDNPNAAIQTMLDLRRLGVTLSLDDFGTGYSSFSHLKRLPVDFLKIDRSFVQELASSQRDAEILSAIAAVAGSLGIGLVAEGVETPQQADVLVALGCNELQGFLFSKPLPAEEAVDWIEPDRAGPSAGEPVDLLMYS